MNLTSLLVVVALLFSAADEDLNVLDSTKTPPAKLLYESLQHQAHAAFDRRDEAFAKLQTAEQIAAWQRERREFFIRQLGGFPERAPLNGQVVGVIEENGYRIEKVIYESRPHHHVTANLYLPAAKGPFPAVLVACGHSRTAKASDYNQKICISLARNGIAAFCYDPIGQGERSQILTADGKPKHNGTTTEHFLVGVGSILVGSNTAQYRTWDGMRAIDYLETRPEIDARRIGCTGCSGGGTETSYIMALDDRVVCAAPACYITTFRRLIDTIGPQDAEQNIFGQVAFGMDQPDYLLMRAAKPTLICATTEDFFDIGGSWDALRQAKRIYARLGFSHHVDLVEAEGKHGLGPVGRKAMVDWMRRWLLGIDDSIAETEMSLRSEQELQCTPRGQVLLLPQEQSVFDLNREREQQLTEARGPWWVKASADEKRHKVREMIGVGSPDQLPPLKQRATGTIQRDGYRIDKLVLEIGAEVSLPALLFVPAKPSAQPVLYLHGEGKQVDAGPGGPIEQLSKQGSVVLAVDLRGLGETAPGPKNNELLGAAWKEFYLAYLLGKSMVGLRTDDVLAAARYLAEFESNGRPKPVRLIGIGEVAVPALHAVALQPQRFAAVRLDGPLASWTEALSTSEPAGQLIHAIHGVLGVYDVPDLVSLCEPAKVTIESVPRPVE